MNPEETDADRTLAAADTIWLAHQAGTIGRDTAVQKMTALYRGGITETGAAVMLAAHSRPSRYQPLGLCNEPKPQTYPAGTGRQPADGDVSELFQTVLVPNHTAIAPPRPPAEQAFANFRKQAIAAGWRFAEPGTYPVMPEPRMMPYNACAPADLQWAWPQTPPLWSVAGAAAAPVPLKPETRQRINDWIERLKR